MAAPPPPLHFPHSVFDIHFHPTADVLAVALVDGSVSLHAVAAAGGGGGAAAAASAPPALARARPHTEAVRALRFSAAGDALACASADGTVSLLDARGAATWRGGAARAAGDAPAANCVEWLGAAAFASGDDAGAVHLWDARARAGGAPAATFAKQEDVVAALVWDERRAALLAAAGDGTLGVYDLRKAGAPRLAARSAPDGEELLSLALLKGGALVVAGTQDGVLLAWDWGRWVEKAGDAEPAAARFTGHPESIDALLAVDDDTVITGSSDGLLRLVTLRPNKLVGVVGEHGDDPVERLAWGPRKALAASAGHDDAVRFWDTAYLFEEGDGEEEEEGGAAAAAAGGGGGGGGGGAGARAAPKKAGFQPKGASKFVDYPALPLPRADGGDEDEEDEDEDEDEEEEDDDDNGAGDDAMDGRGGKGGKGAKPRTAKARKAAAKKKGGASFADLD